MRQGNDVGTQYRSAIYTTTRCAAQAAEASKAAYGKALAARGLGAHHHRDRAGRRFYFAEDYHQQYLAKNPGRLLRARRDRRVVPDRRRASPPDPSTGQMQGGQSNALQSGRDLLATPRVATVC